MGNAWYTAVPAFKGSLVSLGVDEPVMEVDGMKEGSGPELGEKARTIQKCANLNCQSVVVYFHAAILGGTFRPSGFNDISKILKHCVAKDLTPGKFAALIRPDEPVTCTVL
jgi:hypothetical protein